MSVVNQRESGRWQAKVRRKGWPVQTKTFRTRADAEAWSRAVEREMDVGAFISRDDAERTTFQEAADRYLREVLPSKRGRDQDETRLKMLVQEFGPYSLASLSPALLSAFRDKRLQIISAQSVVHELGLMSRILKTAAMDWGIALPHGIPTALVRKPKVENSRTRRLEIHEETLLFAALEQCSQPWPKAATILAIETAARQSEILSLKWDEVDLKRRVARLRGKAGGITKSGEAYRDVPLSSRAVGLLNGIPRSLTGRVIPLSQNALQLAFERALNRARHAHLMSQLKISLATSGKSEKDIELECKALIYKKRVPSKATVQVLGELDARDKTLKDFRFHDLRHEATSRLADRLQMHELMKVTGHKSSKMLSRYYHPRAEDLAAKLG